MNCHLAYDILSSINQKLTVKNIFFLFNVSNKASSLTVKIYFDMNGEAYQDYKVT